MFLQIPETGWQKDHTLSDYNIVESAKCHGNKTIEVKIKRMTK